MPRLPVTHETTEDTVEPSLFVFSVLAPLRLEIVAAKRSIAIRQATDLLAQLEDYVESADRELVTVPEGIGQCFLVDQLVVLEVAPCL